MNTSDKKSERFSDHESHLNELLRRHREGIEPLFTKFDSTYEAIWAVLVANAERWFGHQWFDRFCLSMSDVADRWLSEDLPKVLRRYDPSRGRLSTVARASFRNSCINPWRRANRKRGRMTRLSCDPEVRSESVLDELIVRENQRLARTQLAQLELAKQLLSEAELQLLREQYEEELSAKCAAERHGIKPGAIDCRRWRVVEKLRSYLKLSIANLILLVNERKKSPGCAY